MNSLWMVVLSVLTTYLAYNLYVRASIGISSSVVQGFRNPRGWRPRQHGIHPAAAGADAAEFVKNRVAMQQEHMQTIWKEFDGSVRAIVPLFETEVRGVPMLHRLCDAMFAADGLAAAPGASVRPPQHIGASR